MIMMQLQKACVVAPVRERGLKWYGNLVHKMLCSRSREGAWIEINASQTISSISSVAPVRERGLKCYLCNNVRQYLYRRSREGAWIEIKRLFSFTHMFIRRSREGAWIEMLMLLHHE